VFFYHPESLSQTRAHVRFRLSGNFQMSGFRTFGFFSFPDSGHLTLLRFKKSPRFLFQDGLVYWKRKFLCYDSWSAATLKHSSCSIQVGKCIPKFLNPFLTVAYRWPALFCCTCKNVFPLYI
jgi:hypothetical protein